MTASDGVSPSPKGGPESARPRLNPPLSKGVYFFWNTLYIFTQQIHSIINDAMP